MLLFSFSYDDKKADELVFKNSGLTKLLCAFNEIEKLIKKQIAINLYLTNFLM